MSVETRRMPRSSPRGWPERILRARPLAKAVTTRRRGPNGCATSRAAPNVRGTPEVGHGVPDGTFAKFVIAVALGERTPGNTLTPSTAFTRLRGGLRRSHRRRSR